MNGKIIKGIGGFYYVHVRRGGDVPPAGHEEIYRDETGNAAVAGGSAPVCGRGSSVPGEGGESAVLHAADIWECRAKGIFRNQKKKPLIGDDVEIEAVDAQKKTGNIVKIYERTNELVRPSVANVDQALVVFSVTSPEPSLNLLDRMLLMTETLGLPAGICFQKIDLDTEHRAENLCRIYRDAGYPVFPASALRREGVEEIAAFLDGRTTCLAGPSGVGKSTWMNLLCREERMETGEISEKSMRGKHTTRHAELIALWENTYLVDTPGFGALDITYMEPEELKGYFPEFAPYEGTCRFPGCVHRSEPDCSVKDAVENGQIHRSRYESYAAFYEELKERKRNLYK
ncbi:MAG: ribosome small subunit-dependent GTPase A [Lachnospiraceae bacterium]|nr:ribosome small subunit-dependent GTPase A [Lachnospiraceae bacterium]